MLDAIKDGAGTTLDAIEDIIRTAKELDASKEFVGIGRKLKAREDID